MLAKGRWNLTLFKGLSCALFKSMRHYKAQNSDSKQNYKEFILNLQCRSDLNPNVAASRVVFALNAHFCTC